MKNTDIEALLLDANRRFPLWQPQDAVKLLYQRVYGCEHFVSGEEKSLRYLQQEWAALPASPAPPSLWEPLGGGWGRLNLAAVDPARLPLPLLNRMFCLSSVQAAGSPEELEETLQQLEALGARDLFTFSSETLSAFLAEYRRQGCPSLHHSEDYRRTYRPAYRVLREEWLAVLPLLPLLTQRLQEQPFLTAALDGPAASGKTTLARLLARLYDAPVVHMDDFFLPSGLRTPERLAEPGGNIDYERFSREVVPGLQANCPLFYRRYSCARDALEPELCPVPAAPLRIVEGSYSLHPRWQACWGLKIFLTVPAAVQEERILRRNGAEGLALFRERWIPLENQYFSFFQIPSLADIIL